MLDLIILITKCIINTDNSYEEGLTPCKADGGEIVFRGGNGGVATLGDDDVGGIGWFCKSFISILLLSSKSMAHKTYRPSIGGGCLT
jgi:hypothetical protein